MLTNGNSVYQKEFPLNAMKLLYPIYSYNFQVTGFCRSPQETRKSSPTGSVTSSVSNVMLTPSRQLTDAEKLRKVISELVDTERAYVKVI